MKLTGKCLAEFKEYIGIHSDDINIDYNMGYDFNDTMINALIIEFFDSVGIIIVPDITRLSDDDYGFTAAIWSKGFRKMEDDTGDYITRTEAINAAIEKANILLNSK